MREITHDVDLCVVGGGLAGLCAAVAAARGGARVVLMHDRPVLGGNASSEIRMWVGGCGGAHNRETGILEEIFLDNMARNPTGNYSIWDSILYEKARFQPGLTLLLNTTCQTVTMDGPRIAAVTGWQMPTETTHTVRAAFFADCSGDALVAHLAGAECRTGREARALHAERFGPDATDALTMGNSCLIQMREMPYPVPFTPPAWAHRYPTCEALNRYHQIGKTNFWWIELGGDQDTIHDGDAIRDELLRVAFGVWDHLKNHCTAQDTSHWMLEWVGFLPGKRESRRIIGDQILCQDDLESGGHFDDVVAYGGWTMDDHTPYGFADPGAANVHYPVATPYGIPYRSLYARSVGNLFMAGRNISASHAAFSSTRVMATCALMGQAIGTAAAVAIARGLATPRAVYEQALRPLQQQLMADDCYLPGLAYAITGPAATAALAASAGDPAPLRDGIDRVLNGVDHAWQAPLGAWAEYRLAAPTPLYSARLVFDSDLNRPTTSNMPCCYPLDGGFVQPPAPLVRAFRLEAEGPDGQWQMVARVDGNVQRLVHVPLAVTTRAIRLIPESTWGAGETARVFAWGLA